MKDKIKVIFRGKEKEQETEVKEEEQITELIQAEVPEEEADKEQEVIQENTELADNIKEVMKKFPLKSPLSVAIATEFPNVFYYNAAIESRRC